MNDTLTKVYGPASGELKVGDILRAEIGKPQMFNTWLLEQGKLQTEDFGVVFESLRKKPTELAEFLTWNFAAAFEEMGEMMHELRWAPWKQNRGEITTEARDAALEECVDVLHFLGNILNALDVDDKELSEVYHLKLATNRARLVTGRSLQTPAGAGGSA